jgi:hypothetical protein
LYPEQRSETAIKFSVSTTPNNLRTIAEAQDEDEDEGDFLIFNHVLKQFDLRGENNGYLSAINQIDGLIITFREG